MSAKKVAQLGMPVGTAANRLRKMVLFRLLQRLGETECFRCGDDIETVNDLSIEHKVAWLDVDSALFWDLDNISFAHLSCNVGAGRRAASRTSPPGNRIPLVDGQIRCTRCKQYKDPDGFSLRKSRWTGREDQCRDCRSTSRKRGRVVEGARLENE